MIEPNMLNSGRIYVDWQRYIREGLIDEINVWGSTKPPYELINEVLANTASTNCKVSTLHCGGFPNMQKYFAHRGVIRGMIAATEEFEHGYFDRQPVSALDGNDFIAKLSVLHQMTSGVTPPDIKKIISATHDNHTYVRRVAVASLGTLKCKEPLAVAAVEACLDDPEAGVRSYAVDTLAVIGNSASIDKIYEMLAKKGNFLIKLAVTGLLSAGQRGLASLPLDRTDDLLRGLKYPNPQVRDVCVEALGLGIYRPSAVDQLIVLSSDDSTKVRREVARTLSRYKTPKAATVLLQLLDDKQVAVRVMAAASLKAHFENPDVRNQASVKLRNMFASYNNSYKGDDADWAWRHIGESLEKTGPTGIKALNEFLDQRADMTLSDHAWQILYVKLSPEKALPITSEDAQAGYLKHPKLLELSRNQD